MANGYMTSATLRAALKREVTNEHALLEVLQQLAWTFKEGHTAGDALTDLILTLDDHLNNTQDPTLGDLAQLADFRRRSLADFEVTYGVTA